MSYFLESYFYFAEKIFFIFFDSIFYGFASGAKNTIISGER